MIQSPTRAVKHGGGSVMAWACMASLDRSSNMNSEVLREKPSAQMKPNAAKLIGRRDTPAKKTCCNCSPGVSERTRQSPDLNPTERDLHSTKTTLQTERPTNKQQPKTSAGDAWKSITGEEAPPSATFQTSGSRCLQRILNKISTRNLLFQVVIFCLITLEPR